VSIPSAIDGDAPAQLGVTVTAGNSQPYGGRMVAISAIAHPSYAVDFPAASLIGGTLNPEPYAPGSQVRNLFATAGRDSLAIQLPIPSVYAGLNRVFAIFKSAPLGPDTDQPALSLTNPSNEAAGPTVIASGNGRDWQLADLGAFRIPSQYSGPSQYTLKLRAGETYDLSVARVVILPDDKTSYAMDTPLKQRVGAAVGWNRATAFAYYTASYNGLPIETTTDTLGNAWVIDPFGFTGNDYSVNPTTVYSGWNGPKDYQELTNSAMNLDQGWYPPSGGGYALLNTGGMNTPMVSARVMVKGNGTYMASSFIGVRLISKSAGADATAVESSALEARLFHANSSQMSLELSLLRKSGSTQAATRSLLASRGFDLPAITGVMPMTLDLALSADNQITARAIPGALSSARFSGAVPTVLISGGTPIPFASVGASVALSTATTPWRGNMRAGLSGYKSTPGGIIEYAGVISVTRLIADEINASPVAPGDTYTFDGVNNQYTRSASGADVTANLSPVMRGRFPQANPSTAKIAVLSAPLYRSGPLNDALSVTVTVRERFRYAR
ncbi:MAG: hypothetical protein EBX40_06625, partial [Gammaproteobacteria bacterium]|nr:hypothetical protein [Gammaproteobacteria bacterium]